jgi:hypothetical protein
MITICSWTRISAPLKKMKKSASDIPQIGIKTKRIDFKETRIYFFL